MVSIWISNTGEFVVFVVRQAGKSTLLRMIAGLGNHLWRRSSLMEQTVNDVSPSDRGIAMVFPVYALYPHAVRGEHEFGLRPGEKAKLRLVERVVKPPAS